MRPRRQGLALLCGPSTSPLEAMARAISFSAICAVTIAAFGLAHWVRSPAFALNAVRSDSPNALRAYLLAGGDANLVTSEGSLVYVATGPNGGSTVLSLLLRHGADPNHGRDQDTPLMNAASWCALDAVRMLLEAHADPHRVNARGQSALETICAAPEPAAQVTAEVLEQAMASNNRWRGP